MKQSLFFFLFFMFSVGYGQNKAQLTLSGEYSRTDSIQATKAYLNARLAVSSMQAAMDEIWQVSNTGVNQSRKEIRRTKWNETARFVTWMGAPDHMRMVKRKINRLFNKFNKNVSLVVTKQNKGRCRGWISAWAIPHGNVRIVLCEDYFIYRTYLQDKILIHEMGHEIGMFSHLRIHGCRAARRAAASRRSVHAKKSPENYAWLAMSFLGLNCGH